MYGVIVGRAIKKNFRKLINKNNISLYEAYQLLRHKKITWTPQILKIFKQKF